MLETEIERILREAADIPNGFVPVKCFTNYMQGPGRLVHPGTGREGSYRGVVGPIFLQNIFPGESPQRDLELSGALLTYQQEGFNISQFVVTTTTVGNLVGVTMEDLSNCRPHGLFSISAREEIQYSMADALIRTGSNVELLDARRSMRIAFGPAPSIVSEFEAGYKIIHDGILQACRTKFKVPFRTLFYDWREIDT